MWLLRNSLKCWLELCHCSIGSRFQPPHHGLSQPHQCIIYNPASNKSCSCLGKISSDLSKFLPHPQSTSSNVTCLHLFIFHRDKSWNFAHNSMFSELWLCPGQTQAWLWVMSQIFLPCHSGSCCPQAPVCSLLRALCNRFFLIFRACASSEEITGLIISLGKSWQSSLWRGRGKAELLGNSYMSSVVTSEMGAGNGLISQKIKWNKKDLKADYAA